MELAELQHSDRCRWWDDEEFCDCGADTYEELQAAKKVIESLTAEKEAAARSIGGLHEELAAMYEKYSGKQYHENTCAISLAPAERPGPCNCAAPYADNNGLVRQLRRMGDFTEASMLSLGWEAAKVIESAESSLAQAREELAMSREGFRMMDAMRAEAVEGKGAAEQREKGLVALVGKVSDIVGQPSTCDHCEEAWEAINEFNKAALAAASKEEACSCGPLQNCGKCTPLRASKEGENG